LQTRIGKGWEIFEENRVEIKLLSPNFIHFEVKGTNDAYHVDITNDVGYCDCIDFQTRWNKKPGSFSCKHVYASLFLLKEYLSGIRRIRLSKGYYALVDAEDYDHINQWPWHVSHANGDKFYAQRGWRVGKKTFFQKMHREIMQPGEKLEVDHINGNALDNRKENLRIVTRRQQMQNLQGNKRIKTSKYPGVIWRKSRNKWISVISIEGKQKNLYYGDSEEEAYLAYKKAVEELGETVI